MPGTGNTIALIPARGGSKGLPGKNIKPLAGKPLIQYTIEAAQKCNTIDAVYVSTDEAQIAEISQALGATVVQRPSQLATDQASSLDVVRHFLEWYQAQTGTQPETLVLLQPTSPLRNASHLSEALAQYQTLPQPASLVSVTVTKPIAWQGTVDTSGLFKNGETIDPNSNRQDEVTNYVLNGALYCTTPTRFAAGEVMKPSVYAYKMPQDASVDIDTQTDFDLAEVLMKRQLTAASRKTV